VPENGSPFIQWLGQTTKLLFVQPALLLTFVQIGIVLSTFALTQLFSAWQGLEDYERKLSAGIQATYSEVSLYQQRRQFARFLAAIGGAAVGYFFTVPILLLLMTYTNPPTVAPSLSYVLLTNSAFVATLIPTVYVSVYFVYYRLFCYRFHQTGAR